MTRAGTGEGWRHEVKSAAFLASVVFAAVFSAAVVTEFLFDFLSSLSSVTLWGLSLGVYGLVFGCFLLCLFFSEESFPDLPEALREWTSHVGFTFLEVLGVVAAVVAVVVATFYGKNWALPLPTICGVGFLLLMTRKDSPQVPVRPELEYTPPSVPEPLTLKEGDSAGSMIETRNYVWDVHFNEEKSSRVSVTLPLNLSTLEAFRKKNPYADANSTPAFDFKAFAVEGTTQEVFELARQVRHQAELSSWSDYEEICATLAFAQSMKYEYDDVTKGRKDYWRYPIETLYDQVGDCEDHMILAGSALKGLGYKKVAGLLIPENPGKDVSHVALGVAIAKGFPTDLRTLNGEWFFCETTAEGWKVGEVPEAYVGLRIVVQEL